MIRSRSDATGLPVSASRACAHGPRSGPDASQVMAASVVGTSEIASDQPTTTARSCSRSVPSSGGMGAGCSRLWKAAASRSFALPKCR